MKNKVSAIYNLLKHFGLDLKRLISILNAPRFLSEIREFKRHSDERIYIRPILYDYNGAAGGAKGHYFHQDLIVARKIFERNPSRHIDIGSRIDGFVAHVASFREIEVIDIRPLEIKGYPQIKFLQLDMSDISSGAVGTTDSISSLHAVEHFGLGRYGDPIKTKAHLDGLKKIFGMLKHRGTAYISVPIGRKPGVYFNEQRIFQNSEITEIFKENGMQILEFYYVNDTGDLVENINPHDFEETDYYGCGIYILEKI